MFCTGFPRRDAHNYHGIHEGDAYAGCVLEWPITSATATFLGVTAGGTLMGVVMMITELVGTLVVFQKQGDCPARLSGEDLARRHLAEFVVAVPAAVAVSLFIAYIGGISLTLANACLVAAVSFVAARLIFFVADVLYRTIEFCATHIIKGPR